MLGEVAPSSSPSRPPSCSVSVAAVVPIAEHDERFDEVVIVHAASRRVVPTSCRTTAILRG